jgi:hypothetical protein
MGFQPHLVEKEYIESLLLREGRRSTARLYNQDFPDDNEDYLTVFLYPVGRLKERHF